MSLLPFPNSVRCYGCAARNLIFPFGLIFSLPAMGQMEPAADMQSALSGGKASLNIRLRYEDVTQDNPLEDASALTLRTRLGYTTARWNDLDLKIEFEDVHPLGSEDYNSGPPAFRETNGKTTHSVIADPEGTEVNQLYLGYYGLPATQVRLGRQRLILDNARFIGNVGWRQNEQTFDGVNLVNTGITNTTINYSYLFRSNFIFFNDFEMDTHLFNVGITPVENLKLTGYAYLLDFDQDMAARRDTRTIGGRATGALPLDSFNLLYAFEYASQSDYADSPSTVDADYSLAELGIGTKPFTARVGLEVLGGDGVYGFQVPLATNHAFQGWADLFLATPATGIRDSYLSLNGPIPVIGGKWKIVYHDFKSDEGSTSYGDETDLVFARPITKNLGVVLKYANYSAHTHAVDTRRLWLQTEFKF